MSIFDWIYLVAALLVALLGVAVIRNARGLGGAGFAVVLFILALLLAGQALGAPPAGGPGPHADWYRGLERPNNAGSCCSEADCRPVEARVGPAGYEALITPETHGPVGAKQAEWIAIPEDKIIRPAQGGHPEGRAVLCWMQGTIYCFVRPLET